MLSFHDKIQLETAVFIISFFILISELPNQIFHNFRINYKQKLYTRCYPTTNLEISRKHPIMHLVYIRRLKTCLNTEKKRKDFLPKYNPYLTFMYISSQISEEDLHRVTRHERRRIKSRLETFKNDS